MATPQSKSNFTSLFDSAPAVQEAAKFLFEIDDLNPHLELRYPNTQVSVWSSSSNTRIFRLKRRGKLVDLLVYRWLIDHQDEVKHFHLKTHRNNPDFFEFRSGDLEFTRELIAKLKPRVKGLAFSLSDAPLEAFRNNTRSLSENTEVERLTIQRRGQSDFRDALDGFWRQRCPLTGISDRDLLRASHIVPWSRCRSDKERLNPFNGLLLSALWDAAFDGGLVTFEDNGCPKFSPKLSEEARKALIGSESIELTKEHRKNLKWHRDNVFKR